MSFPVVSSCATPCATPCALPPACSPCLNGQDPYLQEFFFNAGQGQMGPLSIDGSIPPGGPAGTLAGPFSFYFGTIGSFDVFDSTSIPPDTNGDLLRTSAYLLPRAHKFCNFNLTVGGLVILAEDVIMTGFTIETALVYTTATQNIDLTSNAALDAAVIVIPESVRVQTVIPAAFPGATTFPLVFGTNFSSNTIVPPASILGVRVRFTNITYSAPTGPFPVIDIGLVRVQASAIGQYCDGCLPMPIPVPPCPPVCYDPCNPCSNQTHSNVLY